ncbi:NAD(P)/FAD-dependent oxidoreductase [Pseudonocardia nigra]|uniref:NAD(P)/FAD-dependent oxidoreductase n=1 Tax=Pseudonocardia nigra TaxID=1921578 RepID=UPI001C5F3585|nr:FAD-dependent oxidoreductase [Pseudonocardia nigra]
MVVVGGGECGARAALAMRAAGWTGPVTLVGEEAMAPYERPPLSKAALIGDAPSPATICDETALRDAGISFLAGVPVTHVDRDAHEIGLADGRRLGYERLLLATGAAPRRLPLPGADGVRYLRTHADALALRERLRPGARVGVVGGGFIGLELAASAVARGCTVTVVEVAPRLMGRVVPVEVAAVLADRHTRAGVDVRCGVGLAGLEPTGLDLDTGETVPCDVVVAGIGAVPETALAEKAGLAVDDGLRVDARLATSDPDVFAAGDCCSFPHPLYDDRRIRLESWRNAQDQGTAAARSMLGADEPFAAVPWMWSDQYELTLQIAGLPDAAVTEVVRRRPDGVEIRFGLGEDGRLLAASAVGEGNAVARDVRVAELLVGRRATPAPAALADPAVPLKSLLRGAGCTA